MNRQVILAAAAVLMTSGAVFAANPVVLNDENTDQIRTILTEDGYQVGKIKIEDGLYEAYARKDGERLEVFLNGDFEVVRTKVDD